MPSSSANVRKSLTPILRPRSIAVIGASRDPLSIPGRLFHNLSPSFRGPVYPINPNAREIGGLRAWPSILDVPEPIDVAYVAVPVTEVLNVVHDCAKKGIRGLVLITAGFSEKGDAGRQLEAELLGIVRSAGIRMAGPNCVGVMNASPAICLNGTFAISPSRQGRVAVGTQSGALAFILAHIAVGDAFDRVTSRTGARQALIQQYLPEGLEILIGVTWDPAFGHVLAFGLGGVFVELIREVSYRLLPLSDRDAAELLGEVRMAKLLGGYRGVSGDVAALKDSLLRTSALVTAVPEIVELDLNPLKVFTPSHGVSVVDARVRMTAIAEDSHQNRCRS